MRPPEDSESADWGPGQPQPSGEHAGPKQAIQQSPSATPIPSASQGSGQAEMPFSLRIVPRLLLVLIVLLVMLVAPPYLEKISYHLARGRQQAARDSLQELTPTTFAATSRLVAEAIQKSVVDISIRSTRGESGIAGLPLSAHNVPYAAGQGSGVIVDAEGYILTNFHVINGATKMVVHLDENRHAVAELVGVDEYTDLAVLKIQADGLLAATWGDSNELAQGDPVWAIGSPWGLNNSVSFGIVSAVGRDGIGQTRHQELLQTDAAVNPGNSGGALVNAQGELVGINTAIVGDTYRGVSFAIPSNMARDVFLRLKENGEIARGWLGVRLAARSKSDLRTADRSGAVVIYVMEDSPAEKAGIRPGDVVRQWAGKAIENPRQLSHWVAQTSAGKAVAVMLLRGEQSLTTEVQVGRLPRRLR